MVTRESASDHAQADKFGQAPFVIEASVLAAASELGLLRSGVTVCVADPLSRNFGTAYDNMRNVAEGVFDSQKALRSRFKEMAQRCGFQIYVAQSSVRVDNGGNAKYRCKKLNGQQFFDSKTLSADLNCPFHVNVYGNRGEWKVTRVNFAHNHVKFLGTTRLPCAEGTIERQHTTKRNTTLKESRMVTLVITEMLPTHDMDTSSLTGKNFGEFLKVKGFDLIRSSISRIKLAVDDKIRGDRVESYQKLESYLATMAEKNPGSVYRFEKAADGVTFYRACVIPSIGIHVARCSKRLFGFDGAHLKGEMHRHGIYLVATAKDHNNYIFPFGFALVPTENYDNWLWFVNVVAGVLPDVRKFCAVTDRPKGLLTAVAEAFPEEGHRFCLRPIKDNINRAGIKLTPEERVTINYMA
jgi:hypothetical protein